MYSLPIPKTTAADSYSATIATITETQRRAMFASATSVIQAQCDAFDQLAAELRFDRADSKNFVVRGLSTFTMSDLYDAQFVKRSGTKAIRDSIKNAAPYKLCPYCGEGSANQLDHYLPKKAFEGTAVHPANLVPACSDCNYAKRNYTPSPDSPAVLHPYFDTAFETPWLSGNLTKSSVGLPVINFEVSLAQSDPELEARLNAHMQVFDLWNRFSVWAAQSLNNLEEFLVQRTQSLQDVRTDLQKIAVRESGGRTNSWEGAAYGAMLRSDWYLTCHLGLT